MRASFRNSGAEPAADVPSLKVVAETLRNKLPREKRMTLLGQDVLDFCQKTWRTTEIAHDLVACHLLEAATGEVTKHVREKTYYGFPEV